jgi:hypothetical protein
MLMHSIYWSWSRTASYPAVNHNYIEIEWFVRLYLVVCFPRQYCAFGFLGLYKDAQRRIRLPMAYVRELWHQRHDNQTAHSRHHLWPIRNLKDYSTWWLLLLRAVPWPVYKTQLLLDITPEIAMLNSDSWYRLAGKTRDCDWHDVGTSNSWSMAKSQWRLLIADQRLEGEDH